MSTKKPSDVFSKTLKIQAVTTAAFAILMLMLSGWHASISLIFGGASVMIGSFAGFIVAKNGENNTEASAILINFLKAEVVKILVIIFLLIVTFKLYLQLVPFALIAGLAAAALFSGLALSRLKI